MASIDRFYDNEAYFQTVYDFVNQRSVFSLRLLEYFFTKFAEKGPIWLPPAPGSDVPVELSNLYATSLKTFRKIYYDCFRRNHRIELKKHGLTLVTTIGQLQWFMIALRHRIIEYVAEHITEIEGAMAADNENNKQKKSRKRRYAITAAKTSVAENGGKRIEIEMRVVPGAMTENGAPSPP